MCVIHNNCSPVGRHILKIFELVTLKNYLAASTLGPTAALKHDVNLEIKRFCFSIFDDKFCRVTM